MRDTDLSPNSIRHLHAAQGYCELGLYDESADELEKIGSRWQTHPYVISFRIKLYQHAGKWEHARILAESFAETDSENPEWWVSLGYTTRRANSVEAAYKVMQEAVKLHPNNFYIQYNLACYSAQIGEMEEAKSALAMAIQLNHECRLLALDDDDLKVFWDTLGS